jgi:hypothetical protein
VKSLARYVFLSDPAQAVNEACERLRQRWALRHWERTGRRLPPPHVVKQSIVKAYAARFSLDLLVETGTYLGAMIDATLDTFRRIHSIELDAALYARAQKRYGALDHVSLYNGDSSHVLAEILAGIGDPCLFWLDAHHSGVLTARGALESPILHELERILSHPVHGHVILADDTHDFTGQGGYPTLAALQALIAARRPGWTLAVKHDVR